MNKIMYVVWYGDNNEKMACFTDEEDAGAFAEQMGGLFEHLQMGS